jgi:hypothetical protein
MNQANMQVPIASILLIRISATDILPSRHSDAHHNQSANPVSREMKKLRAAAGYCGAMRRRRRRE